MKLARVTKFLPNWGRYWNQIPFRARLVLLGFALTAIVLVMEGMGALSPLENWLYDIRARNCQFYAKAPTTQLVHLDIDDAALDSVGKWPWDRRFIAEVIDEIREAGAMALSLDITFSDDETQGATQQSVVSAAAVAATTAPTTAPAAAVVESQQERDIKAAAAKDAALAAAVKRFPNIILAADFSFAKLGETELRRVVREQLRADLELTPEYLTEWLRKYGGPKLRDSSPEDVREVLVHARREVAREKLLAAPSLPVSELLPKETRTGLVTSPLLRLVENERQKARAILTMSRLFPREVPEDVPDLLVATGESPPLEILTQAIWEARKAGGRGMIGSVTSFKDDLSSDGVVRSVPLLINDRGKMMPQFGLALACMVLGVDPQNRTELSVGPNQIVLTPPGRESIVIPISTVRVPGGKSIGATFAIPWFGGPDWTTMYNWPKGTTVVNHFPITWATSIVEKRNYQRINEASQQRVMGEVAEIRELADLKPADPKRPFAEVVEETLAAYKFQLDGLRAMTEQERREAGLDKVLRQADNMALLSANSRAMESEIATAKEQLRRAIAGRAVIVGSTASSAGDLVTTSLHSACPGSVVHGVIFNAVVTRSLLARAPAWISYLIAICFGIAMTFAVSKLTPWRATFLAVFLVISFAIINGLWLFDRYNIILNASAPLAATVVVWAGCSAANAGERFRIMQMLRGYIDPALVEYLQEHSEKDLFSPRMTEMTVVFTDLQGFTTISQELGEKTAPLISRYMSVMVEVIRRRGGIVNKFLGDGIMFFFGAPEVDPKHPENAVITVLEMHKALEKFNQEIKEEGYPELAMRCGVSTGNMVVGNAGPEDAKDYTVLGDAVNLGARLEAANKACNTRVLVTERTYNLTRNSFLYIPVGKLKVRGRSEGSMTYEAVCRIEEATAEQKQLADAMQAMILAFTQGVFDGCMNMVGAIEKRFGEHHSCRLYRQLCHQYTEDGVPEGFHGEIFFG